jgi:hypothetical protein
MPREIRSSHVHPGHYGPPCSARPSAANVPTTRSPAAANALTAAQAQGPNPLWAINIGMGIFFGRGRHVAGSA